jgi:hypothetical protein
VIAIALDDHSIYNPGRGVYAWNNPTFAIFLLDDYCSDYPHTVLIGYHRGWCFISWFFGM